MSATICSTMRCEVDMKREYVVGYVYCKWPYAIASVYVRNLVLGLFYWKWDNNGTT